MKIIKYLNFNKIIFSIFCTSLLFFFSLPKIDAGPNYSDDYEYWYIATHLSKTGEYGFIDTSLNDKFDHSNPLNNAGIRRGEPLYPFIISNLIEKDQKIFKISPKLLTLPDYPSPTSHYLTKNFYVNKETILRNISEISPGIENIGPGNV